MSNTDHILFTYNLDGKQVVSAIHWRDLSQFLKDHPDATRKVA
jgi:hypothetical protein